MNDHIQLPQQLLIQLELLIQRFTSIVAQLAQQHLQLPAAAPEVWSDAWRLPAVELWEEVREERGKGRFYDSIPP